MKTVSLITLDCYSLKDRLSSSQQIDQDRTSSPQHFHQTNNQHPKEYYMDQYLSSENHQLVSPVRSSKLNPGLLAEFEHEFRQYARANQMTFDSRSLKHMCESIDRYGTGKVLIKQVVLLKVLKGSIHSSNIYRIQYSYDMLTMLFECIDPLFRA